MKPETTRRALTSLQVCVPQDYTDEQVIEFANADNPTGLDRGWAIRREGDPLLVGDPERMPCESRAGCVHIMLDC